MGHAIRTGVTLSFGLISCVVRVESARNRPESLTTLCIGTGKTEHAPLKVVYPPQCVECGPITDPTTLVKGLKDGAGYRITSAEDVKEARAARAGETAKHVALSVNRTEQVRARCLGGSKSYFLLPENNQNHYNLIVELLRKHPEVTLTAQFSPRSAPALFELMVHEDSLMLNELVPAADLRPAPELPVLSKENQAKVTRLLVMAEQVLTMAVEDTEEFTPEPTNFNPLADLFKDATVVGIPATVAANTGVEMDDLEAVLAESISRAQAQRNSKATAAERKAAAAAKRKAVREAKRLALVEAEAV